MLLNSVIILLREVLEAALLISVFLAYNRLKCQTNWWLGVTLLLGLLGAVAYGSQLAYVSEWFDGVGQEVINAIMHGVIYIMIVLFLHRHVFAKKEVRFQGGILLMIVAVTTVTVREGAEIYAYLQGFSSFAQQIQTVMFGALIGTGIGISVGVFVYYLLVNISLKQGLIISSVILILEAGSMVSQSVQLLMQADWLNQTYPLWDSSAIINEASITGQLLYALMGYESTPTALQVVCYLVSMIVLVGSFWYQSHRSVQ